LFEWRVEYEFLTTMTCLEIAHAMGARAQTTRCQPFELPDELPPGTEVLIIGTAPGTTLVRNNAGREWQLSMCNVTAGMLYQLDREKQWRGADDPRVIAELRKILATERARLKTCDASTAVVVEKACEGIEAQLANG
jgi:hypothetical protein